MHENAIELLKRGDARFSKRTQLDSFRQEIALNFAPWHASWQAELQLGDDFAGHLVDGTPLLLARDFVGQIGAMLRPPGKQWFWHRSAVDKVNNSVENREYLDWRSKQMMRIMTDRVTGYGRAMKQTDEFYGLFGDAVLSVDRGEDQATLRLRCWHTKDCVWAVGSENRVDTLTRRERTTYRVMKQRFGEKAMHPKAREACEKDPDGEVEIRHEVLPADEYDAYRKTGGLKRKSNQGYASVWFDVQNRHVLRETTTETMRYVVPRWVTLPNWAYAISPATTIALPDARLIQQQAAAILEAAEKQINPPLIAVGDTIRGTANLEAAGITWIDPNYDSRSGDPLQALELGKNFQLGVESLLRTQQQITRAFFLDTLRMPDTRSSKSTEEVRFLIDEYVRAALPLFAPMREEYSDAVLFEVDSAIDSMSGYDRDMPEGLHKEDLVYSWDNPLSDMIERNKAQVVSELAQIGNTIAALEAAAAQAPALKQVDTIKLMRESAMAVGGAEYLLDEDDSDEAMASQVQAGQQQQMIAAAPNMAQLIDSGVNAAQVAGEIPQQAEPGFALPMPA